MKVITYRIKGAIHLKRFRVVKEERELTDKDKARRKYWDKQYRDMFRGWHEETA